MILIVGLGNPGKRYKNTRHNLGFRVIEELRLKFKNFSVWKYEKKSLTEISQGKINNQKVILIKPQTFMNNSGKAVKQAIKNFIFLKNCNKIAMAKLLQLQGLKNLWVVHDDLDLPLGKIKISFARGSAGHKGVQSIINALRTKNFVRFRVGISPLSKKIKKENFVLEKFKKNEGKIIKKTIEKAILAIELSLREGLEKAMQEFNK